MEHTPEVVVQDDPADVGLGLPGHLTARGADGLDAVEIRFRYDGARGPKRSLAILARACLEVLVAARRIDGTHSGAKVTEVPGLPGDPPAYLVEGVSREAEGSRWNG